MANGNVCLYNKFGFCKFKETCKFRHISEKCELESCKFESCDLRHPKECRFFNQYRRCKFGDYCFYKHKEKETINNFKNDVENVKTILSEQKMNKSG